MPLYPEKSRGTSARPPATYKPPAGQTPRPDRSVYNTLDPETRAKIDRFRPPSGNQPKLIKPVPDAVSRPVPLPVRPPKNVDRPITNMPVDPRGMEQRKMREQEMLMAEIARRRAMENARMGRSF